MVDVTLKISSDDVVEVEKNKTEAALEPTRVAVVVVVVAVVVAVVGWK